MLTSKLTLPKPNRGLRRLRLLPIEKLAASGLAGRTRPAACRFPDQNLALNYTREERIASRGTAIRPTALDFGEHLAVSFRIDRPDGSGVDIVLMRSAEWVLEHGAVPGGRVFLDMPDMGVQGWADVLKAEAFVRSAGAGGRIVTGTFRHRSGRVIDLLLADEPVALGVTATHPFWSVDRAQWVSAAELRVRERVRSLEGEKVIVAIQPRQSASVVYNLEVEGDHVYRVGRSGILVHNASVPSCIYDAKKAVNACDIQSPVTSECCDKDDGKIKKVKSQPYCQGHHIIPCKIWKTNDRVKQIAGCCSDTINLNGPKNYIKLPCCDFDERSMAYHIGTTPDSYLNDIQNDLIKIDPNKEDFCGAVDRMLEAWREKLCTKRGSLNNPGADRNCCTMPNGRGKCIVPCR